MTSRPDFVGEPAPADLWTTCLVTKARVLTCDCGPHIECPEHALNCADADSPDALEGESTADRQRTREDIFEDVYAALAGVGVCDSPGGGEYRRVREEWERAGRPPKVAGFIEECANYGGWMSLR